MNHEETEDLALRRTLLYVVLPFWLVPGIGDWYWHKRSDIEHTSGTHESLTHVLMMGAIGLPITAALFLEINELVIASMIAGCIAHEAITIWDVAYANGRRTITNAEQHTHSFLEVLPFFATALTICHKPEAFAALFGRGRVRRRFRFEAKRKPLSRTYIAAYVAAAFASIVAPYGEEFVRCYRVDRTIFPHESD